MEIYICSCCGYLVIFRNWNGKSHHPIHLPTGWPCWRMVENGECGDPEPLPFPIPSPTSPERWRQTVDQGLELYRRYRKGGKMEPFLALVDRELGAGRVDVAKGLMEEVLHRFANTADLRRLFGQIVASNAWLALADRARRAG